MLKAKAFLRDIRTQAFELRQLQMKRDWLYSALLPKGINYKSVDVQESGPNDKLADKFSEIYDLEKLIEARIQALIRAHLRAENYVGKLEDTRYRVVLERYYLSLEKVTWQQVADEMGYNEREIYRFHGNALVELDKILESCQ